jgi:hypothetical protein
MITGIEMAIDEAIKTINERKDTKTNIAKFFNLTTYAFDKKVQEEGYVWDKKEKRYNKINDTSDSNFDGTINFDEGFVFGIETNINVNDRIENKIKKAINIKDDGEINSEINSKIKSSIETERNIKMENENKIDVNNDEIDDLFESIDQKEEKKYIPTTTHLRPDISEALNKFAKGKKGAKQDLINGLLEMALRRKGYL